MDGNARWARRRNLPSAMGHEAGVSSLRSLITSCASLAAIETLTVYAFSAENWGRPASEVNALLGLVERSLEAEAETLHGNGVRLTFIGDLASLPAGLRALADRLEKREPPRHPRLILCVALSYGGRQSVARAARALAERVSRGELEPAAIDEQALANELRRTAGGPPTDPDLVLRTGGQQRLSNFLTYECAYAELRTTECLWPDFDVNELAAALEDYGGRSRTMGVRR
jgi:undecaprenyl diphosphate synthase